MSGLKFDPASGEPLVDGVRASKWRSAHSNVAWLFDPWTGARRDAAAVGKDVLGRDLLRDLQAALWSAESAPVFEALVRHGCGIDADVDELDNTPLLIAAARGHLTLVNELLLAKADVNLLNANSVSVLHFASLSEDVLRLVLGTAAAGLINSRDMSGATPLLFAIKLPPRPMARDEENCDDFWDRVSVVFGNAEYDYATAPQLLARVQLLLNAGAEVNSVNNAGRSALMNAARLGYPPLVELLLDAGALPDLCCSSGKTAIDYAGTPATRAALHEASSLITYP